MRPVLRSLWLAIHLAIGLCSSAPEALDLTDESQATLDMYGIGLPAGSHKLSVGPSVFGRQCLIARRLVQRGVRFIQICTPRSCGSWVWIIT
ncbi:MAG: DUF1501 domain-containing protein [Planctomycetota bacterium]